MRIQHNIAGMNIYRNYSNNAREANKTIEKLSSGYSINRAADNAAGLAISEKMRMQITGLEVARRNAKDGIGVVQTADGALTEVHDILNRMYTLAEQSANGTYSKEDRWKIQGEVDELFDEIDRIAETANFNGIALLNGDLAAEATTAGTDGTPAADAKGGTDAAADTTGTETSDVNLEAPMTASRVNDTAVGMQALGDVTVALKDDASEDAKKEWIRALGTAENPGIMISYSDFKFTFQLKNVKDTNGNSYNFLTGDGAAKSNGNNVKVDDGGVVTWGGSPGWIGNRALTMDIGLNGTGVVSVTFSLTADLNKDSFPGLGDANIHDGDSVAYNLSVSDWEISAGSADTGTVSGNMSSAGGTGSADTGTVSGGLVLQIGETGDECNRITVHIDDMHAEKLFAAEDAAGGTKTVLVTRYDTDGNDSAKKRLDIGVNDENTLVNGAYSDAAAQETAASALSVVKNAINTVSTTRGELGSIQNRLDHVINDLGVALENAQEAESVIRDTDVAEEMLAYTKSDILNQMSETLIAQANQVPQGVLQLLG